MKHRLDATPTLYAGVQFEELQIITRKGESILIDSSDFPMIRNRTWSVNPDGYVITSEWKSGKTKIIYMHRFLTNAGFGQHVHHKNGIKTDNRRGNLELLEVSDHKRCHMSHLQASNEIRRKRPKDRSCVICSQVFRTSWNYRNRASTCSQRCETELFRINLSKAKQERANV
jgi:hypothetical protein